MYKQLVATLKEFHTGSDFRTALEARLKQEGEDVSDIFYARASSPALDRDREVLIPRGVQLQNFLGSKDHIGNPVLIDIHNYRSVPVGRVLAVNVTDDAIDFAFRFAESSRGQELKELYEAKMMNTFSVGFIPESVMPVTDETPDQVDVEINNPAQLGEHQAKGVATEKAKRPYKYKLDLTKYPARPRAIIAQWELLEISPVPVPSNPEALIQRGLASISRKHIDSGNFQTAMVKGVVEDRLADQIRKFFKDLGDIEICGPVPQHTITLDSESNWDKGEAINQLARWASEDGSGNKDSIDFGKFAQGFAWFNSDAPDKLTSYKLPHHLVIEDRLVTSWKGLTTAMSVVLSGRADLGGDDKEVYAHLARHYRDNGQEPPEFSRDYSEEDIKDIAEQEFEIKARQVQTLIFSKESSPDGVNEGNGWTREAAINWAKEHEYKSSKVDETENSYRLRQFDPVNCDDNFATITSNFPKGISVVVCEVPDQNAPAPGTDDEKLQTDIEEFKTSLEEIATRLDTRLKEFQEGQVARVGLIHDMLEELNDTVRTISSTSKKATAGNRSAETTSEEDDEEEPQNTVGELAEASSIIRTNLKKDEA